MKTYKGIVFLFLLLFLLRINAQEGTGISGNIKSAFGNEPVKGAIITVSGQQSSVTSDSLGFFSIDSVSPNGDLKIWAPGYYENATPVLGRKVLNIVMIPLEKYKYNQSVALQILDENRELKSNVTQNINKSNIEPGTLSIDNALQNAFAGLHIIKKSGMPGEGSYFGLRGIRTLIGNNAPLIVVNGVPYIPDMNESPVIGGYSQSIFNVINVNDIENITLLKGAEASLYGSMGANGVLLIETSKATDMETVVEFSGLYGVSNLAKTMPVLNVGDFKSYIGDIGVTKYEDMGEMLEVFPFLKDDPNYYYNFLYNNNTDWQSEIFRPAFVTDNTLRIKGGDAIAKYNISLGYLSQAGTLKSTQMDRYNAHLNLNISLSRKIELFASVGFSYINKTLQEQGLLDATNPILTAIYKAPILSPYKKDEYNHQLPTYDVVRQFGVTNPLAAVNTIDMNADLYNLFFDAGANYKLTKDIKLTGLLGLFYNYNRETGFIPGKSSGAIAPLEEGIALNTERAGTGQALNLHFNLNSQYSKKIGIHSINGSLGYQALITQNEFDAGKGRNSSSDFYKTLSYVSSEGRQFWGYINMWNWMSTYAHADYTFNSVLTAAFNVSLDGSSSSGKDAPRFGVFPSASLTWKVKNMNWLKNLDAINMLNLRAGYSVTGNSRFSPNISKYYYTGQIFRQLSGIVRGNIPNTDLRWESTNSWDFGIEASALRNRIQASITYYETLTGNVIIPKTISSVYGIGYIYDNAGKISNKGVELWLQAGVIESKEFGLVIGGTATMNKSILKSLGGETERITEFEDGSAIISRVGESPYNFYGYKSNGVFSSQTEATVAALSDYKGDSFNAGDIHFMDIVADNIIDNKDRSMIGNAEADLYGNIYTNIRFKGFSLSADFGYSFGNEAYNGTRRKSESMSSFYNQSSAVNYRWQTEGQITEIPKAVYGDPMQNSRFSDRWIEDASYVRLNNLTLSYRLNKGLLRYIQSGTVFIAGENLFTITNYLGYDPETAYSYNPLMLGFDYAKLAIPRTVKFGVKLQF